MCKALIERGANVLHQDAAHKTAAIYAKKNDKNEVYEYLNAEIQKLKIKNDDKRKIKKPPQVKQQYKMMKSDEFGNAVEMTEADFEEFLKQYPDFRAMFENPDGIDPEKIKQELGWYPETTFEVGIKKTIQWYLEQKDWMDNVTSGDYQNYYNKMYAER